METREGVRTPQLEPPAHDGEWRLAYLLTGDRAAAERITQEVRTRAELAGGLSPTARRALLVGLARRSAPHPHGDRLWTALRPLPRRRRAEILVRLP